MSQLGEWLSQAFSVLPRIWVVEPDEGGIRTTLGSSVKDTPTGWYINWPIIHVCTKRPITPQVVDLRGQSALTNDAKDVVIGGALQYKIVNARKAILEVNDLDLSVVSLALGIIQEHVSSHTFGQLLELDGLKAKIRQGLREATSGWGIKIVEVFITDLGTVKNIRFIGDGNKRVINAEIETEV